MRVEKVIYKKLVNLGNYSNEQVGVVVLLEPGESPHEALTRAQAFVEKALEKQEPDTWQLEQNQRVVDNPDDYAPKKVREAQVWLANHVQAEDEIPF
jgi:hypothetical protein